MKSLPLKILFFSACLLLFAGRQVIAQELSKAKIDNIDFGLQEGKIVITYDLLKSDKNERFIVFVNAITESGDTILARSVSGDVNENVSGGREKTIVWDYERDHFFSEEAFQIEVTAVTQLVEPSELSGSYGDYPGLGTSFLMSTVFPGWASTRLKDGKPHWVKGIVGYGCLSLSYLYNKKAANSYADYKISMDRTERNNLYDDAVSQKQWSSLFALSALVVWIMDYTCIIISHNKLMKNTYNTSVQRISFGYDFDPVSAQPQLSVKLTF